MNHRVNVSERAVVARVNRIIAKDGEKLHKARGRGLPYCGALWYVVDHDKNWLVCEFNDLEHWARNEVPVLKDWEVLKDF